MNKRVIYLLSFLFVLLLALSFFSENLLWDEASYLSNSKFFLGKSNYKELHRPLLLPWMIAGIWAITGPNLLVAQLVMIGFSLLSIFLFYKLCKIYFERPLYPTALFAFSPLLIYWSFRVYTDVISMAFIILSSLLIKKDRYKLAGGSFSLALLLRFTRGIFGLAVVGGILIEESEIKEKLKKVGYFVLGSLLLLSPWLVYNLIKFGNPIYKFIHYFELVGNWSKPINNPFHLALINFLLVFNLSIPFLARGLVSFKREGDEAEKTILIYLLIFFLTYFLMNRKKPPRYLLLILPFLSLASWKGIISANLDKNLRLVKVLFFIFLIIPAFYFGSKILKERRCWGPIPKTMRYLKKETTEGGLAVSNIFPFIGYYTKLKAFSPWTDLQTFKKEYGADYYVKRRWGTLNETRNMLKLKKKFRGSCSVIGVYKIT